MDGAVALQLVIQAAVTAQVVVGRSSRAIRGADSGRSCLARYRSIS